jgi:DNA (cytosine-5)-methyltransferase 1
MAGARIRNGFIDDPRNYLFKHYFNVVKTVKPKVFVMENVKGMKNMQGVCRIADKIAGFMANAEAAGAPITYRETAKRSRSS